MNSKSGSFPGLNLLVGFQEFFHAIGTSNRGYPVVLLDLSLLFTPEKEDYSTDFSIFVKVRLFGFPPQSRFSVVTIMALKYLCSEI